MKKIVALLFIGLLLISTISYTAVSIENTSTPEIYEEYEELYVSSPTIRDTGTYTTVELNDATSPLRIPGNPKLPKITKVFVLPFKAKITQIAVQYSDPLIITVDKPVIPVNEPLIEGSNTPLVIVENPEIYASKDVYPQGPYSYHKSTGLLGNKHVTYVAVHCYPLQYIPVENKLLYSDSISVSIKYEFSKQSNIIDEDYDLVIISPSKFVFPLQKLVSHKNKHGVKTFLTTVEDVLAVYQQGRDDIENLKLYICDMVETKNISYVLLVGGVKRQTDNWYIPVRRVSSPYETNFLTDLYYADLYDGNGNFSDWDSNGNGKIGEFPYDILDCVPDVHVGRLPCRNIAQVRTMVRKIILYEGFPSNQNWFNQMLCIGGDTYPDKGEPEAYEAELDTNVSASYMNGFDIRRIWVSEGSLRRMWDVERAISQGAGFIHIAGHANPSISVTYPIRVEDRKITMLRIYSLKFINVYYSLKNQGVISGFEKLIEHRTPHLWNFFQLPVVVVGGCHNSQFDTSVRNILSEGLFQSVALGDYVPKCWSWFLTSKPYSGAIATLGNTGYGMSDPGYNYTQTLDGWLFPRFFYHYNQKHQQYLGMAHTAAITDFVNEFDINVDGADRQMVQQWAVLGDPSLMMGGYNT